MRTNLTRLAATLSLAGLVFTACSRQEEPTPAAATEPVATPATPELRDAETAVRDAATNVQQQAAEAQQQMSRTVSNAVNTSATPPAPPALPQTPASPQLQSILDDVKRLMSEKKYQEALTTLAQVQNVNLTAEQQNLVNQLKAQIQKALASDTVNEGIKSVGGLLQPKNNQ